MPLDAYAQILRKRQVQAVVGAAAVAGLNVGAPLAIVLMVQHETGSFADAGAVTAAVAIAGAIAGPVQGRLIDRYGQTRIIVPMAIGGSLAIAALVAATLAGAPPGALIAIAALAGAVWGSVLPSMRPVWADLVDHPRQLNVAYAIQAVLTELMFIVGPLAAATLIALGSPAAAVLVIAAARFVGMLAFAATPASRRWRTKPRARHSAGALASAGLLTLVTSKIAVGAMFGALDVGVPAFAKAEGVAAAAGLALSALAVGSSLGGIAYGARPRPVDGRVYAVMLAIQAVLLVPLTLVDSVAALAAAMAIAGLVVAPVATVAFGLLDRVAPAGTATEATSWLITAYQLGLAAGTGGAGALVERSGTVATFAAALGCAALAFAIALTRRSTLDRAPAPQAPDRTRSGPSSDAVAAARRASTAATSRSPHPASRRTGAPGPRASEGS
jgi:MFS family permease